MVLGTLTLTCNSASDRSFRIECLIKKIIVQRAVKKKKAKVVNKSIAPIISGKQAATAKDVLMLGLFNCSVVEADLGR